MTANHKSVSAPIPAMVLILALAVGACAVAPDQFAPVERACYRTLGRVDCHASPLPDDAGRRVGFFDWAALGTAAGD